MTPEDYLQLMRVCKPEQILAEVARLQKAGNEDVLYVIELFFKGAVKQPRRKV